MSRSRIDLLQRECQEVQRWLDNFSCVKQPRVRIEPSGETISISNFPLPDGYRPDYIDIALIVAGFPSDPPKGLYLWKRPENDSVIQQLTRKFNIFHAKGFHGAPSIAGFEWICIGHLNGWQYRVNEPHKGDNISKMLAEFFRLAQE